MAESRDPWAETKAVLPTFVNEQRLYFLADLIFHLSIATRSTYSDSADSDQTSARALRAVNEIDHQISQHLLCALRNIAADERYPDDVFVEILRDHARAGNCTAIVEHALHRALRSQAS